MNTKFKYILLPLLMAFMSCGDKFINDIDIEVPEQDQKLVINLDLQHGALQATTFVARTSNISEVDPTFFDNALVSLYKDGNLLIDMSYDALEQEYTADFDTSTLSVAEYTVEVSNVDGLDNISATQIMPSTVSINEATFTEDGTVIEEFGFVETADEVLFEFDDPADEENFYVVRLFQVVRNEPLTARTEKFISSITPLAEELTFSTGLLLNDNSFNGKKFELSLGFFLDENYLFEKDEIAYLEVELSNISQDHYLYLRSLDASRNADGNPFAEPVIVHNNVENGVGIFRTTNTSIIRVDF